MLSLCMLRVFPGLRMPALFVRCTYVCCYSVRVASSICCSVWHNIKPRPQLKLPPWSWEEYDPLSSTHRYGFRLARPTQCNCLALPLCSLKNSLHRILPVCSGRRFTFYALFMLPWFWHAYTCLCPEALAVSPPRLRLFACAVTLFNNISLLI